jgi:hypothetical protein
MAPHDDEKDDDGANDILPKPKKRSPLVLVGAGVTAAVLFAGLAAFRDGNFATSQRMMRLRVLAQSATIGTMVATSGVALHDLGGGGGFFATKKTKDDAE